jgi:hypothetical protein
LEKLETYHQRGLHQELFEVKRRRAVIVDCSLISVEEPKFLIGVAGGFQGHLRWVD